MLTLTRSCFQPGLNLPSEDIEVRLDCGRIPLLRDCKFCPVRPIAYSTVGNIPRSGVCLASSEVPSMICTQRIVNGTIGRIEGIAGREGLRRCKGEKECRSKGKTGKERHFNECIA